MKRTKSAQDVGRNNSAPSSNAQRKQSSYPGALAPNDPSFDYEKTRLTAKDAQTLRRKEPCLEDFSLDPSGQSVASVDAMLLSCKAHYVSGRSVSTLSRINGLAQSSVVRLYATLQSGASACFHVWNFTPYMFINPPRGVDVSTSEGRERFRSILDDFVRKRQSEQRHQRYGITDDPNAELVRADADYVGYGNMGGLDKVGRSEFEDGGELIDDEAAFASHDRFDPEFEAMASKKRSKRRSSNSSSGFIRRDDPFGAAPTFGAALFDEELELGGDDDLLEAPAKRPRSRSGDNENHRVIDVVEHRFKTAEHFQTNDRVVLAVHLRTPNLVTLLRDAIDAASQKGEVLELKPGVGVAGPTYESGVPFENRFMLDHDLVGTGWFRVSHLTQRAKSQCETHCSIEFDVDHSHVVGYSVSENLEIYKRPARMRVLSYDIECIASEGFPDARFDPVSNINCVGFCTSDPQRFEIDVGLVLGSVILDTTARGDEQHDRKGSLVTCFRTEAELLDAFAELIVAYDPDILTGYNIVNFDNRYLFERAKVIGAHKMVKIGRSLADDVRTRVEVRQSKNLGNSERFVMQCEGRVVIDMMLYAQNNMYKKLRSYKLNAVAAEVLNDQKEDVDHTMIPILHRGSRQDRTRLMEYCRKDAQLPARLMHKLSTIPAFFSLTRVQRIQLDQQQNGGASFRVFSQLLYKFRKAGFVVPYRRNQTKLDYQGATVFEPRRGFYQHNPIPVLDFASLYPSIACAGNFCITTHVLPKDVAAVLTHFLGAEAGEQYRLLEASGASPEELEAARSKVLYTCSAGNIYVRKVFFHGVFPQMLTELLELRNVAKKAVPLAETPLAKANAQQYEIALKVSANSGYGFHGLPSNGVYWPWVAVSITAEGRDQILLTKKLIEEHFSVKNGFKHDAVVIYGDSVTGDTPVFVRIGGEGATPMLCTIDTIPGVNWSSGEAASQHPTWIDINDGTATPKSQIIIGPDQLVEVWSDAGWTRLRRVIRHPVSKAIYRINTHTGSVAVTEDHSLLRSNGEVCKPGDVQVGETSLLHHAVPPTLGTSTEITSEDEAFAMGFFFADGSCGTYNQDSGEVKRSWAINKQNLKLLNATKDKLNGLDEAARCSCTFKIIDTLDSSGVYKLVAAGNPKLLVERYRKLFYHPVYKLKVVPSAILNASKKIRAAFFEGYYAGDGDHVGPGRRCDIKGQIGAAGMFWLLRSLGYNVSINTRDDKTDIYRLTLSKGKPRRPTTIVKKIINLALMPTTMVYDLETENHHFAAGVGELVVHNTDSVMVNFGPQIENPNDHKHVSEVLRRVWEMTQTASKLCTAKFQAPNRLAPECIIFPFLLVNKKRYGGQVWMREDMSAPESSLKVKGLETVRRDNCRIVSMTQERCLKLMLKDFSPEKALAYAQQQIQRLLENKVDFYDLIISGQLSKYQKDYKTPQAHAQVRELMEQRNPGSGPKIGDRVQYILVDRGRDAKRFECAEEPLYALKHKLPINIKYYLENQMLKPLIRIFKPIYENAEGRLRHGPHTTHLVRPLQLDEAKGLGRYFSLNKSCEGCGVTLSGGAEAHLLCSTCDHRRLEIIIERTRELRNAEIGFSRVWTHCQSCQGSTHQEIICTASECALFYKRFTLREEVESLRKKISSLDW